MTNVSNPLTSKLRFLAVQGLVALGLAICGCSTMKTTGTPRSGTEQLLLTNTWEEVLYQVDYRPLSGKSVFLDTSHIEADDEGWVVATLKRDLLRHGVVLKDDKKEAKLVLVAALAAYGTDERRLYIGLGDGQDLALGGLSLSTPSLFKANYQSSVVKFAMFAYEAKTSKLVWEAGPIRSSNSLEDRFLFGLGPERRTSVDELDQYEATRPARSRNQSYRHMPGEPFPRIPEAACPYETAPRFAYPQGPTVPVPARPTGSEPKQPPTDENIPENELAKVRISFQQE